MKRLHRAVAGTRKVAYDARVQRSQGRQQCRTPCAASIVAHRAGRTRAPSWRVAVCVLAVCVLALSLLGAPGRAHAIGAKSRVALAQLRHGAGQSVPRPSALRRLAWEIDKRTSIDVAVEPRFVSLADEEALFEHPFLYLSGDKEFPLPPPREIGRLRRYLIYGGTLLIDSAESRPGGGFDRSVRALIERVLPEDKWRKLSPEHTLHKSFYLLERAVGRVDLVPYLEGIERDGRLAVIYTQNDLGGAWARDDFGAWEYNVYPGGERQRERAFRWGVNIVMYALCVDYKADQVHIPFILKRRRWRVP